MIVSSHLLSACQGGYLERALVELSRFAPKSRTTDKSGSGEKPLSVDMFKDAEQAAAMQKMFLDAEEKRLHLTRLVWNRNVNNLKM